MKTENCTYMVIEILLMKLKGAYGTCGAFVLVMQLQIVIVGSLN